MTRKLRTLGLALVAVFAMSAVVASAASALNTDTINSEKSTTVLTGTQGTEHKITVASGLAVACTTALFHGTLTSSAVDEVTIVSTYSGCTFGANPATVTMNGCDFRLIGTTDENAAKEKHATATIDCSTGGPTIVIHVPAISCTITIAPQTAKNGFTIKNEGSLTTRDLSLSITAPLTVSRHGTSVACLGVGTTGVYTGTATVEGYEDLSGSGHTGTEGKHVGIFFTGHVI